MGKYLWLGSGLAVLASAVLSVVFWTLYGFAESFVGLWFEALAMFTAAAVLTYMIFWMAKNARKIRGELQERLDVAVSSGQLLGISAVAFTSVLREGVETILFLSAAAAVSFTETAIGATLGLIVTMVIAVFLMRGTVKLDWGKFFLYTSVLLLLFASGITMHGTQALQELGVLPPIIEHVYDVSAVLPEESALGSVLHVFIGYHDAPSLLILLVQISYLAVFGAYLKRTYRPTASSIQTSIATSPPNKERLDDDSHAIQSSRSSRKNRLNYPVGGQSKRGKSCVFNQLTGLGVVITNYPDKTVELNMGVTTHNGSKLVESTYLA